MGRHWVVTTGHDLIWELTEALFFWTPICQYDTFQGHEVLVRQGYRKPTYWFSNSHSDAKVKKSEGNLKADEQVWRLKPPDTKTCYKAIAIKTKQLSNSTRIDRLMKQNTDLYMNRNLTDDKGDRQGNTLFRGERMIFLINVAGSTGYLMGKNVSWHLPHMIEKMNFRWITGVNVKGKTIKLWEDNIKYLYDLRVGNDFIKKIQKALTIKEKTEELYCVKSKNSVHNDTINSEKTIVG